MSSRGAVTKNGHVTTDEYQSKDGKMVHDAKVLTGTTSDGSFREMRVYDETGFPIIEIAYHPEQSLTGNRHEYVLHYHTFKNNLERVMGGRLSETEHADIYKKYKKYLEEYGL